MFRWDDAAMQVEGVTFNERLVKQMSRSDFIRIHLPVCFLDRDVKSRKRMLSEIYDRILKGK